MTVRGLAASLLLLLLACSSAGDDHPEEIVFRVGATVGLSELLPGPELQGSSAAAVDLVFEFVDEHATEVRGEGNRIVFSRKASSRFTAEQLASLVRYQGLVSARALDAEHVEVVLRDAASVARVMEVRDLAFDAGPFKLESQEPGHARLRRRGDSAIDVIEIVEVSSSDEWRKLVSRELDVMSASPSLYRDQFTGMGSVRLIDIPPISSAALYFNVRDPALATASVRRRIAAGLNRQAIARVANGDDASGAAPVQAGGEEVALPDRLSLIVVEGESTLILAGSVIRHQLDRLNIALDIEAVSGDEVDARFTSGRHQLFLGPVPNGDRRLFRFLTPGPGVPTITGFSDPTFDAAVGAGNLPAAQAILDRELPVTPLYEWRLFAAIDSRFCGKVAPSAISWRWMADLHPCEDGEGGGEDTH